MNRIGSSVLRKLLGEVRCMGLVVNVLFRWLCVRISLIIISRVMVVSLSIVKMFCIYVLVWMLNRLMFMMKVIDFIVMGLMKLLGNFSVV